MKKKYNTTIDLVKAALWGTQPPSITQEEYDEMKHHAILALPTAILSNLPVNSDLLDCWQKNIIQLIVYSMNVQYEQKNLPISVPYVILKGTAAAQYYPNPEYRTMGDIDIMTGKENYIYACNMLLKNGWKEITDKSDKERGRHRVFTYHRVILEIHLFFASMNDVDKAEKFDNYIISNITPNHILPDMINGIVLLEHINQHMEDGIGLRQFIDWMMFVDKCLPDNKWDEFQRIAKDVGLEKLAITSTRMCELYLGLNTHQWSSGADAKLCEALFDYVLYCGNMGRKISNNKKMVISRARKIRHPIRLIRELHNTSMNDLTSKENKPNRQTAWIWKGLMYIRFIPGIISGMIESRRIDNIFKELGVSRKEKGLVYYINGKYTKK